MLRLSAFTSPDGRLRRAARSAAWHLAARLVAIICALAQVPSALRQLGIEGYGFVIAILAGGTLAAAVCDFGLGLAVQTRLAASAGEENAALRRATFHRGALLGGALAAGWFGLGSLVIVNGHWSAWFGLQTQTTTRLPIVGLLLWAWAMACAAIPAGMSARLALAEQRHWINGAAACASSALILGSILACEHFHLPPATVAALLLSTPFLPPAMTVVALWPARSTSGATNPPDHLTLLREGVRFLPSQIAAFWWTVVPPVALGLLVDARAVTQFNLVQRLFGLLHQIQIIVLQPLGPTLTDARARNDTRWLHTCYRNSLVIGGGGFALAAAGLTFAIYPILELWLSNEAPPRDYHLLLACAAWNIAWLLSQPPTHLLTALAETSPLTRYGLIGLAASGIAMLLVAPRCGAVGVVLALALSYALLVWPGLARAARRTLSA